MHSLAKRPARSCYPAVVADAGGDDRAGSDGVTDLLGLLSYASLVGFFQLSDDAALAASIDDKAALAEMAVAEFGHFRLLHDQLKRTGTEPAVAMRPFV